MKGDIFSSDANRSDIVFTSIDHTGLILRLESRQRVWRWLDQRQNFGFTKIDVCAVGALVTLAALSKDDNMTDLAKMILWLALYELRMASWNVSSDESHGNIGNVAVIVIEYVVTDCFRERWSRQKSTQVPFKI